MKFLLVLAVILAIAMAVPEKSVDEQWEEYKIKFERQYTGEEEVMRKAIFAENLVKVKEHNAKYDMGEFTYEIGINQFSDRTPAELKRNHGIRLPSNDS